MPLLKTPHLAKEAGKYLIVGAGGYVIDVLIFNALILPPWMIEPFREPVTAKTISTVIAIIFTYAINQRWTFKNRTARKPGVIQFILFSVVNVLGLLISVGCLGFSHYVLGFDSALADNVSANFFGVGLATIFRFFASRSFVFPRDKTHGEENIPADLV